MKEQSEEICLLNEAVLEIKSLRRRNEIMSARLDMFDSINAMLHTRIAENSQGMSPDLCWKIERFVNQKSGPEMPTENVKSN